MTQHTPRIALVGDRSANVRAHARIPGLIDALLTRDSIALVRTGSRRLMWRNAS